MQLLTKEIEKRFKEVGSQEGVKDPLVVAKFFNPTGAGTWWATEICGIIMSRDIIIKFKKYVNTNSQLYKMWKDYSKEGVIEMQELFKQIDSQDEKTGRYEGKEKSDVQEWDKNRKRLYNALLSNSPESIQKLYKEMCSQDGEKNSKVSKERRDGSSQKRKQARRQVEQFTGNDKNGTQVISLQKTEREKVEIKISSLEEYKKRGYKIDDVIFFGYASIFGDHNDEWGSFSLKELQEIKGFGGLGIERDLHCGEIKISEFNIPTLKTD